MYNCFTALLFTATQTECATIARQIQYTATDEQHIKDELEVSKSLTSVVLANESPTIVIYYDTMSHIASTKSNNCDDDNDDQASDYCVNCD